MKARNTPMTTLPASGRQFMMAPIMIALARNRITKSASPASIRAKNTPGKVRVARKSGMRKNRFVRPKTNHNASDTQVAMAIATRNAKNINARTNNMILQ